MCRVYRDTPDNFVDIEPYILTSIEAVAKAIIQREKCYFYDACSFRKHMVIENPEYIFNYIEHTKGIIVITRCIIMELCSNNKLWEEHIEYIRKMYQHGLCVLVIFEEDIMDVLSYCYTGIGTINRMLSLAVKHGKSKTGCVENGLSQDSILKKELLVDNTNGDKLLATRFFEKVRSLKTPGDNMGEELIGICVHMLSQIRETKEHKYIVLTDDKKAITLLSKTIKNVEKNMGMKCITGVTTAKLCWLIVNELHVTNKDEIECILGEPQELIKVYSSEEYEFMPSEKSMTNEELANKLIRGGIKIYF